MIAALNELELETKQGKKLELNSDKIKAELEHLLKVSVQIQTGADSPQSKDKKHAWR